MRRFENKTDVAKSVLVIAQRVLENAKAGRVYPKESIEWAERTVRQNTPATEPNRARAFPSEQRS